MRRMPRTPRPITLARRMLGLLVLALAAQSCQGGPGPLPGSLVLAPASASLTIRLGGADRSVQYLRVSDWDVAEGVLSRDGTSSTSLTATSQAVVAPDGLSRTATLTFSQVAEGSGYVLKVSLKKRGTVGQLQVVGSVEQRDLTLDAGPNVLALTASPEGRVMPSVEPAVGLGPYVSSIPGVGVQAGMVSVQDVVVNGDLAYFLDNGQLRQVYKDANGALNVRSVAGVDKQQGAGLIDGEGTTARFNNPRRLALGPSGVLYVADAGSNAIRKITIDAKGQAKVSTLAGTGMPGATDGPGATATFNNPSDLVVDADGNLLVADSGNNRIRKVAIGAQGEVTVSTIAGTGVAGYQDGPAASAMFRSPGALTLGPDGTIYVGDSRNYRVRVLTQDAQGQWTVGTLAGSGLQAGFNWNPADDDGPGATARLGVIMSIRRAGDGTLYVDDYMLRRVTVDAAGQATVATVGLYGSVTSDFPRDALNEFAGNGMTFDQDGSLLLASGGGMRRIVQNPDGSVAIRRWVGSPGGSAKPMDGPLTAMALNKEVWYVALDGAGDLFFASRSAVYRLPANDPDAVPTLIAGDPTQVGYQDGVGASARFSFAKGLCIAPDGTIFVSDLTNYCVRKLVRGSDGQYTVSTVAGVPGQKGYRNGPAGSALFGKPDTVALDASGQLFINDSDNFIIRKVSFDTAGDAIVSTVAGLAPPEQAGSSIVGAHPGYADGSALNALMKPMGVSVDSSGNVIFADDFVRIRKVTFQPDGSAMVTTLAGGGGSWSLGNPCVDGIGSTARFRFIGTTAISRQGDIYVSDYERIRKISYDSLGRGVVSTYLGGQTPGSSDGPAELARFAEFGTSLGSLAFAPNGDLFVSEMIVGAGTSARIRRISSTP